MENQASINEKILENQSKAKFHLSHYKSFNPKKILFQMERGQFPKVEQQFSQKKFHAIAQQSQINFSQHKPETVIKKKQVTQSQRGSMIDLNEQIEQKKSQYHPFNRYENEEEPLHKYDEGQIYNQAKEREYIEKLRMGISLIGYTKCTHKNQIEWFACEVTRYNEDSKQYQVSVMNKEKWVSRANLLFSDESKEEFDQRFQKAKDTRQAVINNKITEYYVQEQIQKEQVLMHKDFLNKIVDFTFKNQNQVKDFYICDVIEETVDNFKNSVIRFQLEGFKIIPQKQRLSLLKLNQIQIVNKDEKDIHFVFNEDYYAYVGNQLETNFHNFGLVHQLKSQNKTEVIQNILKIMDYITYFKDFRIFKNLQHSQALCHNLENEYKQSFAELDMHIYKIESLITTITSYISEQLNFQVSKLVSVSPFDHTKNIKQFEHRQLITFNILLTSILHISIKESFQMLLDYYQSYYLLLPFDLTPNIELYKRRAKSLLNLQEDPEQKLLITEIQKFSKSPTNIHSDLKLIISIYQQFTRTLYDQKETHILQSLKFNDIQSFIDLKLKINPNCKKKLKYINIIKFVLIQRQKIYDSPSALKKLIDDLLKDNHEECNVKYESFQKYITHKEISAQRLGWFSWKKLKIVTSPSLSEIESNFKKVYFNSLEKLYEQNQLNSFQERLKIQETKVHFDQFMEFFDEFLYNQFLGVISFILLINQFHFYLSENIFISSIIEIFQETDNIVLINQEKNNLARDLDFIQNKLPNQIVYGIIKIDTKEVKEQLESAIKSLQKQIDHAIIQKLEENLQENIQFNQKIYESLNESPTSVGKYIEMIQYIKSKELVDNISTIKQNTIICNKLYDTIIFFQIALTDNLFYKYLKQLPFLQNIEDQKKQTLKVLNNCKNQFKKLVDETTDFIQRRFKKLNEDISQFINEASLEKAKANLMNSKSIEEQLIDLIKKGKQITEQEQFLGYEPTSFLMIEEELNKFQKYSDLWDLAEKIRYKLESWQNIPFLQIDVHEMIESSREYAYQLIQLQQQFKKSNLSEELNEQFNDIIVQLINNIKIYDNYFQVLIVLKEVSLREKYYQKVMKQLFKTNDLIELQQISIPDLIERNLESQQDMILDLSKKAKSEQQINQKMIEFDLAIKEIQFKTLHIDIEDSVQINYVVNNQGILQMIKEIDLEMQNHQNMLQSTIIQQIENVKEKMKFIQRGCKLSEKLLRRIFEIQDIIVDLNPYFKSINKQIYSQSEFLKIKDEQKKRIDNLKRSGINYFISMLERGEHDNEELIESEEVKLYIQKLEDHHQALIGFMDQFNQFLSTLMYQKSQLGLLNDHQVKRLISNLYSDDTMKWFLLKLFNNISSFNLTNNVESLKVISYQNHYDEEFYLLQEFVINWREGEAALGKLPQIIQETYESAIQQNIIQYLPIIFDCQYNLNKIYRFLQQHTLYFQVLYILLSINFYHDLTIRLYHSYIAQKAIVEFETQLQDQLEYFIRSQTSKAKTHQTYYQIILLIQSFINILKNFNRSSDSNDPFFQPKSIHSFEYLSLPKLSIQVQGDFDCIYLNTIIKLENIVKKEIEHFENKEYGLDSPTKQSNKINLSPYLQQLVSNPQNLQIVLLSFDNKLKYGYQLSKNIEFLAITPYMERTFINLIYLLNYQKAAILSGPINTGKKSMIEVICFLTGTRTYEIDLEQQNYHLLGNQLGSIVSQGIWSTFYGQESNLEVIKFLSGLYFEIRERIQTDQKSILINGYTFEINNNFRLLGTLNSKQVKFESVPHFTYISIFKLDQEYLVQNLIKLLVYNQDSQRIIHFWNYLSYNLKVIDDSQQDLLILPKVLQLSIKRLIEYLGSNEEVRPMQIVREFMEIGGTHLNLSQRKQVSCFIEEEFKEERQTEERNLYLKQQVEVAKEFKMFNQRMLAYINSFIDQFNLYHKVVVVGKKDKKLLTDLSAEVISKLKNEVFQLIIFPMDTLSEQDLLGYYQDQKYKEGIFEKIELTLLYQRLIAEDNFYIHQKYERNLIMSHLIHYPSIENSKLNQFTDYDWMMIDNPKNPQIFMKQSLNVICWLNSLHNIDPTPLPIVYIAQNIHTPHEQFQIFLKKLCHKHKFFKSISAHLNCLFYFFALENSDINFINFLEILLNEFRKKQIANGFFTYKDFKPQERKVIFDPSSLQQHSKIQIGVVYADHPIFGLNDERIKQMTEALFIYSLVSSQERQKENHKKYMEKIDRYNTYMEQQAQIFVQPFALNLLQILQTHSLSIFDISFDIIKEQWVPFQRFTTDNFQIFQRSKKSNILSAMETIRLNPDARLIHQVKGQYQQELDNINRSEPQSIYNTDYILLLMALSKKSVIVSNKKSEFKIADFMQQMIRNRVIKLNYNFERFPFFEKINPKTVFLVNLENSYQSFYVEIEDFNLEQNQNLKILRQIFKYKAAYIDGKVMKVKSKKQFNMLLYTDTMNHDQVPTWMQEKSYYLHYDVNNLVEIINIYNIYQNDAVNNIVTSFMLAVNAFNLNLRQFFNLCSQRNIFNDQPSKIAEDFVRIFKTLHIYRPQQDVLKIYDLDSSLNVVLEDLQDIKSKEQQSFQKNIQHIGLLQRNKDGLIKKCLKNQNIDDVSFIENLKSLKSEISRQQLGEALLHITFGSVLSDEQLKSIYQQTNYIELEDSVDSIIFDLQGKLKFDKIITQRIITLSLTTLKELLQKLILTIKLKVNQMYWVENGISYCEIQGVLEILQEYYNYQILQLNRNNFNDSKLKQFVVNNWENHKMILINSKDRQIIKDVFELIELGFNIVSNDRWSNLSQENINYLLNKKLILQVIVVYEGNDENEFNQLAENYSLFPNWIKSQDIEESIYNNYADRSLFINSSAEFDQILHNLEQNTPRMKELIYRLQYQIDQYFQKIKQNFHKNSLYSEVLVLLDEKIKQFNQNIQKQEEEINFLEQEKIKIAKDKIVIHENIKKQGDELIENQNLLEVIKDQGDKVSIENEKKIIELHSQLKQDIQQLSYINHQTLFKQLQSFTTSSENVFLYQEFFLFFIIPGKKPEKIKSYDAFNQIRPQKHNEFLSLFCDQRVNFKIKALEQTNFLQLSKDTKEYFEHIKEFSDFRTDLINTKTLQLIHKIVEEFYDLISKQDKFSEEVVSVQSEIQNTKELIKKIQLDVRITRDNVIQLDKKQVAVTQQIEQYSLRIQKIQQHLEMLQSLKQKFKIEINDAYLAENYFISFNEPFYSQVTFYIGLYLVTFQIPNDADVLIRQYIEILLNESLSQNNGYYSKILEEYVGMDNYLIKQMGCIQFLIQQQIGYLVIIDESKLMLDGIRSMQKMVTENKVQYEQIVITTQPDWQNILKLGQTLVLIDPDEEQLEICYCLMEKYIQNIQSKYFMKKKEPTESSQSKKKLLMRGVSYSNTSTIQTNKYTITINNQEIQIKESFYLIIYYVDKPTPNFSHPISHQFLQYNINQLDNLSAWYQRLVHRFSMQFNSKEAIQSLYKYKHAQNNLAEKQHQKLQQLKNLLIKSDPSSDEFILPIYKITYEEFIINLELRLQTQIQDRARVFQILKSSPQYEQAFMNKQRKSQKYTLKYKKMDIKERTEQSEDESDSGSDEDNSSKENEEGNPEDSINSMSSQDSQNSQMDFQNAIMKPLNLQLFINSKFMDTQYLFYIQEFNILGFQFIETISFMLTVKKIFNKLNIPLNMSLQHIKLHQQDLLRHWFINVILQFSPDIQNVFYFYFGIKYLKLSSEFDPLKYQFLLYGQNQQSYKDIPIPLQELFSFYEKTLLKRQIFGFKSKEQIHDINEIHNCQLKHRKVVQKPMKVKYSLSVTPAKKQNQQTEELTQFQKRKLSSILMPQKMNQLMTVFQDKLENFDHEEFDRVTLQSLLVNINKGTQLRASIIKDQSSLGQIQFNQQLKRISDAMRQSKVNQLSNTNKQFNLSLIHLKSSFIGLNIMIKQQQNMQLVDSYVVSYFPSKHRQSLISIFQLTTQGYLKNILLDFLSGKNYKKWSQFALLPVSFLRNNVLDLKIPLPNSIDIDQVTYLDHLLISKYLKPSIFKMYINTFFGQTLMKEFYYAGKHNLFFLSQQSQNVWIQYNSDLTNIIQDIVEVESRFIKIFYCGYIQHLDLSHLQNQSRLIIINPQCLVNQLQLILQIEQLQLKVYFVTQEMNSKSILKAGCNVLFIDSSSNFKEYFSYFYQENLKRQIKGEISKKQIDIGEDSNDNCFNLNSFLEVKNKEYKQHEDLYNIQEFYKKCRLEILYSMFFYIALKYKKQEYTNISDSMLNVNEMKPFLEKFSQYLKFACSHPFSFFYKLSNMMFNCNNKIMQSYNFYQIQTLMFKQDKNQILISLESQLNPQQIHMYKQTDNETTIDRFNSENITQYLSILPEIEPMDLIGLPYYMENNQNFKESESLIQQLQHYQDQITHKKQYQELKQLNGKLDYSGVSQSFLNYLEKEKNQKYELLMNYQNLVKEDVQKQQKNCSLWLRKFNLSIKKEKSQETFELDYWIKNNKEKKQPKEAKQKSKVHMLKLSKIIRNTVLNEIKKKKDIKISTKMFTKTLQEQKLKQTDNILQNYFLKDKEQFSFYKLRQKKISLHKKTVLTEISIHLEILKILLSQEFNLENQLDSRNQQILAQQFGIQTTKITQLLKLIQERYQYIQKISQQDHLISFDISKMYDPANLIYSYVVTQMSTLNLPLHQIKIQCDRNTAVVNKNDCLIKGLKLKNGYINAQNEQLEDGNTYLEEYPLPLFKLSAVAADSYSNLSLEMIDKIHNNLREEHLNQMDENLIFKDVDFSYYLKKKIESPRSSVISTLKKQKQQASNKKIYFIQLPIHFKGKTNIELEFYIKSLQPQHHWVHRYTSITN